MARRRTSKKPTVYAFIDSQNLNLGTQKVGFKMDWRKFRKYLADTYNVTHAFMFIGYMAENESLYELMHELGFLVALKPTLEVTAPVSDPAEEHAGKPDEKPVVKGNIDADLVLYAMKELPNYDKAIIVSGDGDFLSLIEYLDEQGKLLHIMTPNWQYSSLLKQFEDRIVRIDQLKRELAYHDRKKFIKKS
ncbi:MAG TPA: NYN domain-containing protein [Candidatus Saccharimonadales bacterium]